MYRLSNQYRIQINVNRGSSSCRVSLSSSLALHPFGSSQTDSSLPPTARSALRDGKLKLHKAKQNANGTFSIGKTWNLEDLRQVEVSKVCRLYSSLLRSASLRFLKDDKDALSGRQRMYQGRLHVSCVFSDLSFFSSRLIRNEISRSPWSLHWSSTGNRTDTKQTFLLPNKPLSSSRSSDVGGDS